MGVANVTAANSQERIARGEVTRRRGYASDGSTAAHSRSAEAAPEATAEDARGPGFNDEMLRIMTAAAELRAERARIRLGEDERLAAAEAAAIEDLIRAHARGEARSLAGGQSGSE